MDTAYIKRIGFYLLIALIALALIASLVYHAFDGLSDDLELMFVKETSYDESIEMQAYLSLSEHALPDGSYSDTDIVEYVSGESALVSIGDTVVRGYSQDKDASLIVRISELKDKVAFCKSASDLASRQSVEYLKTRIEKCESNIASASDPHEKNELRREYTVLLAAHAAKMDTSVNYQELIKGYEKEINAAYAELGKARYECVSDVNGAYFSDFDGYEAMLSPDDISSGSLDTLHSAVSERRVSSAKGRLGKVVDMNTWRLVCITDRDTSLRMVKGNRLSVTLGISGRVCSLTVERVVSELGSDKAVVVFSSDRMLSCDDYAHFQTVKVSLSSSKGYKIPEGAVRYENGVSGVYVLRGNIVRFRQIDIIGGDDGYVIAALEVKEVAEGLTALNRYDRIIVRGQDLYDRKVII